MNALESGGTAWPAIADCLRDELAEYGALLGLFAAQQKALFAREAGEVLRLSGVIEQQIRTLDDCRRRREELVAGFAAGHDQPANAPFRALLPFFEEPARPLLQALISEINHLLHRVRRTSRQNHTLLARVVEINGQILQQLQPNAFSRTYSPLGRTSYVAGRTPSTMQVAG